MKKKKKNENLLLQYKNEREQTLKFDHLVLNKKDFHAS